MHKGFLFIVLISLSVAIAVGQNNQCTLCGDLLTGFYPCCAEDHLPDCSECAGQENCLLCPDGDGGFAFCCFPIGQPADCALCTDGGDCSLCDVIAILIDIYERLWQILKVLIEIYELLEEYLVKIYNKLVDIYEWITAVPSAVQVQSDLIFTRSVVSGYRDQWYNSPLFGLARDFVNLYPTFVSGITQNVCSGVSTSKDVIFFSNSTPAFSFAKTSAGYNVLPSSWFVPDNPRLPLFPAGVTVSSNSFVVDQWQGLNLCSSRMQTLGTITRLFGVLLISWMFIAGGYVKLLSEGWR